MATIKALYWKTPTVSVSSSGYQIRGTGTAGKTLTVKWAQIAVRGPNGDADTGYRPGLKITNGQTYQFAGGDASAGPGEYTAWLAYSLDGKVWTDGPKVTFTVPASKPSTPTTPTVPTPDTTPTTTRRVARINKSGLPFNSIVFTGSNEVAKAKAFGDWRGRPVDGMLWFLTRWGWDDFREAWNGGQRDLLDAGGLLVTTLPHAPESEGNAMNERGANDDYRDEQRSLGGWLASQGCNKPNHVLRLDWEANGNWYAWSANRQGGGEASKLAFDNCVKNLRAGGLTQVRFNKCFNKGASQSGVDFSTLPGADVCDVIGLDAYDMWMPAKTDGQWTDEINRTPGVATTIKESRARGMQWSIDEGGNTHGDSTKGGDNPFYWEKMWQTVQTGLSNNAWHCTYNDRGAPAELHHDFASNPISAETYRRLWGRP